MAGEDQSHLLKELIRASTRNTHAVLALAHFLVIQAVAAGVFGLLWGLSVAFDSSILFFLGVALGVGGFVYAVWKALVQIDRAENRSFYSLELSREIPGGNTGLVQHPLQAEDYFFCNSCSEIYQLHETFNKCRICKQELEFVSVRDASDKK